MPVPRQWMLLADDMTGAADTALAFYTSWQSSASKPCNVQVYPHPKSIYTVGESYIPSGVLSQDPLALHAYQASLRLTSSEEIRQTFDLADPQICPTPAQASAWQAGHLGLYLKIDSTLRGAWYTLLACVWQRLTQETPIVQNAPKAYHVVLSPVVPSQQRWTREDGVHGIVQADGTFLPVHQTPMGLDPVTPVTESCLWHYFAPPWMPKHPSGAYALSELPLHRVAHAVATQDTQGYDATRSALWVLDAMEAQAFQSQVQWLVRHLQDASVLWVGAAGLAEVLGDCIFQASQPLSPDEVLSSCDSTVSIPSSEAYASPFIEVSSTRVAPALVLIQGSMTPLSFAQGQALIRWCGAQENLSWHLDTWEQWLQRKPLSKLPNVLQPHGVYMATSYDMTQALSLGKRSSMLQAWQPSSPFESLSFHAMAGRVYQHFLALRADTQVPIIWCLVGGETTSGVLQQAFQPHQSLRFQGQLAPNIPLLVPSSYVHEHGVSPSFHRQDRWVTKSGFFGKEDLWKQMVELLGQP
ncbi:MAG: four-carbon acid sugar kinase family protein [Vampirovibrionales bacterium]